VKQLSGAPLCGRLLALPKNNRLGLKGLPGANTVLHLVGATTLVTITFGRSHFPFYRRCHDTQYNDTHHNDIQHDDSLHQGLYTECHNEE
jgi:hypothetical protein